MLVLLTRNSVCILNKAVRRNNFQWNLSIYTFSDHEIKITYNVDIAGAVCLR